MDNAPRRVQLPARADIMPASAAGLSLAAILGNSRDTSSAPQLNAWLSSDARDIHVRLVHLTHRPDDPRPAVETSNPSKARSHRSNSSMAHAVIHQSSTASTQAPSLYNYSEASPTETSISTGIASRLSGMPLLEDNNGVLERRPGQIRHPAFECSFWFLNCSYISYDKDEWRVHCLSHFRGEEPPRSVQCPLCEEFKYNGDDGWVAWDYRMEHVAGHHRLGVTLRASRPDFHLFHHLWQKRLIDDQDLKELKGGNHNLSHPPSNFTTTNGRRGREAREGRAQRLQHIGRRRQAGGASNIYSTPE